MGVHRDDVFGNRHPKVGGQAKAAVAEQMDILRHVGIARLERKIGGQHHAGTQARLHALVGLTIDGKRRIVHTRIHTEDVAKGHVVLNIKGSLVGKHLG